MLTFGDTFGVQKTKIKLSLYPLLSYTLIKQKKSICKTDLFFKFFQKKPCLDGLEPPTSNFGN